MEKLVSFAQFNPIIFVGIIILILLQVYFAVKQLNVYSWSGHNLEKKLGGIIMLLVFIACFIWAVLSFPSGELSLFWSISVLAIGVIYFVMQILLFVRD